ncbi:aldo/keto reductase [Psychromonas ossibalaenae]|uniref:aldo/keto reductase n=1 Tax=Psychromonas ossibalaenae TaxID=444922 RepID=UPI00037141B5|nr:aldo/keto reductase [Psychromonas ossibalaenae]
MKLALGTVQFGLDYGITNLDGKITNSEANKIIKRADKANISLFDTACVYGDSENRLGKLTQGYPQFKFISKFSTTAKETINISKTLHSSLEKLNCSSLYGLLFHDENDLLSPQGSGYYQQLTDLKAQGKIQKIGASFYTQQALEKALEQYQLDLIQIPASCLDQRFQQSGLLQEVQKQNIEVHARSLFLQGLLLSQNTNLPASLQKFMPELEFYFTTAKRLNLTPLQLALAYLIQTDEINYGVVGCQNSQQLLEIINAYSEMQQKELNINFNSLAVTNELLVNPALW